MTAQKLAIHDRFYPVTVGAADVDVEHIRIVDVAVDKEWRSTARTNGFANQHYRSGWFRVASGKKVLMYRADGTRLVLLPPTSNTAPVVLRSAAAGGFAEEVRRKWSEG